MLRPNQRARLEPLAGKAELCGKRMQLILGIGRQVIPRVTSADTEPGLVPHLVSVDSHDILTPAVAQLTAVVAIVSLSRAAR